MALTLSEGPRAGVWEPSVGDPPPGLRGARGEGAGGSRGPSSSCRLSVSRVACDGSSASDPCVLQSDTLTTCVSQAEFQMLADLAVFRYFSETAKVMPPRACVNDCL